MTKLSSVEWALVSLLCLTTSMWVNQHHGLIPAIASGALGFISGWIIATRVFPR